VKELEETLQIVNALWRDERATFKGEYYQVTNAYCFPKPDPLPPIIVGGSKPRMLRLVARYADWWNVSGTPLESYRELVSQCEQACAEVGRDPATLRRTWFGGCLCAPTEEKVKELNQGRLSAANALIGTPAQLVEQMQGFISMGVDYFMLSCGGFPHLTTLEMLVNEVLPALNA
jgi:alkanesulfonate monooxygenase SsuD/methylene tetrahydromethanopterin reductase-like flavin-dependent oxidoreductase (luciferase family)